MDLKNDISFIINKKYSWGDSGSYIKFLENLKIDAFGEGNYTIIDNNNITAYFNCKEYHIKFNDNYTEYISTSKDDLSIIIGKILNFYNKKVITFSLWGNNPTYTIGAIKNVEQIKNIYPDFECWFYIHQESVPNDTVLQLQKFDYVKIIYKTGDLNVCKPMMWRFEAIDDPEVEIMMSRDTDTRIWLREKLAVEEWLQSGKLFHIMRDHPLHKPKISGGMFGTRKIPEIKNWKLLIDNYEQKNSYGYIQKNYGYDQNFLEEFVYPLIKDNSIIHASFSKYEEHAKDFPIPFDEKYNFVGEYVYSDDSRNKDNIENLIKSL
jgi:protein O-GlcNAc transferase